MAVQARCSIAPSGASATHAPAPQLTLWAMIRRHSVADWRSLGQLLLSMMQRSKLQRTGVPPVSLWLRLRPFASGLFCKFLDDNDRHRPLNLLLIFGMTLVPKNRNVLPPLFAVRAPVLGEKPRHPKRLNPIWTWAPISRTACEKSRWCAWPEPPRGWSGPPRKSRR